MEIEMKHSLICYCGFETPLVERLETVDIDMLDAHQMFCEFKPDWSDKTVAELVEAKAIVPVSKVVEGEKKSIDCLSNHMKDFGEEE